MISKKAIEQAFKELAHTLGDKMTSVDRDILEKYSRDETSDLKYTPDILVRVKTTSEVSAVLEICNRHKVPVFPRGAGTGVTGGAVPVGGGVVLSLEHLNKIIEIDKKNMIAVVEPGVITGELQKRVREEGLMYPPDPASLESCSIGGNVAEGAGGPQAVKYGTTKDYVLGLEYVLPDGSIHTTGGKYVKNATGYSMAGLLIGAEGTLAVITRIILRLISAPRANIDLFIPFESIDEAIETVYRILTDKILPAALEFMEEDAIKIAAQFLGEDIPHPDAKAHLLLKIDGNSDEEIQDMLERLTESVRVPRESILVAQTANQRERLWKARRAIREAIDHESPVFLAEDCVVPRSEIASYVKTLKRELDIMNLRSIIFGHAGDGNVHTDVLKGDMDTETWHKLQPKLKKLIYTTALDLGGTITGEHGIGFTRKDYLGLAVGKESIELFKRIKKAFDPNGILNPGKIFD